MRKKESQRKLTEFEIAVVTSCLAGKLVRNEFTAETTPGELNALIRGWIEIAQSAQQAMTGGKKRA